MIGWDPAVGDDTSAIAIGRWDDQTGALWWDSKVLAKSRLSGSGMLVQDDGEWWWRHYTGPTGVHVSWYWYEAYADDGALTPGGLSTWQRKRQGNVRQRSVGRRKW